MYKSLYLLGCCLFTFINISLCQSYDQDRKIGKENSIFIEQELGVYQDEELTNYIAQVCNRLVQELGNQPFDYSFKIADTETPNAFALPGGYTYITRGLLAIINNEDELAGVMAHEIIHCHERHAIDQLNKREIFSGLLKLPGNLVGLANKNIGNILTAPVDATQNLIRANYSRKNEKEADKQGIEIASAAGYDPQGMINCLNNLSRNVAFLTGEKEKMSIMNSHPVTTKRVKYLNKNIPKLSVSPRAPVSSSVLDQLDGLLFGPNPAKGVFRENVFLHPGLNLHIAFPKEWLTFNEPTSVIAIQKDQEAGISFTLAQGGQSLEETVEVFKTNLGPEQRKLITSEKAVTVNGYSGQFITMTDKSEEQESYVQLLWLEAENFIYQIFGFGLEKYQTSIKTTGESVRSLTSAEQNSITKFVISIIEAKEGETLTELNKRSGNVARTDFTAVLNGLDQHQRLSEGQKVKIILAEPFFNK